MEKSLRSLAVAAGIAAVTAFSCNLALADSGATATPQTQGEHHRECQKGKHHRGHRMFARLAKKLGLTDQQKTQAKALYQKNREQAKPLVANMMVERHKLRDLIHSGSADETAIRAQFAKVSAIQADLTVQRAQAAKQFLAILTPDQQTKLKAIQARRAEKREEFLHDREDHEQE